MNIKELLIQWNQRKWEEKNRMMYAEKGSSNQWPWYNEDLDPDILIYIKESGLNNAKILDLGTCSGSQAIALAKLGFDVVGTDISETALKKAVIAKEREIGLSVNFLLDDITQSNLPDANFDLILDRGCFHSICCFAGVEYVKNVQRILKPGGILLLKTMSAKETRFVEYNQIGSQKIPMPYHFEEDQLRKALGDFFNIVSIKESFFYSAVVNPPAKAYLSIIQKNEMTA
ncbi:MAG TPA: class I SAM-dependent methyltransferase [Cellvibrio sp.]|nr:class I SAM-dependent methyltransferase [Cellvibrio sp.]